MDHKLLSVLKTIFSVLSQNEKLVFQDKNLFEFSETKISIPIGTILSLLLEHKSKLPDQFIDCELLKQLIDKLTKDQSIIRLNHVGFCYKVASQEKEKEKLMDLIKKTNFHLYQEKSNDDGLWLFIGDTNNWEDPMIELLPVEKTNDKWVDYWLPHIQIDIDTNLTAKEIKNRISQVFGNAIKPYFITIDGIVYIVRNYLGTIEGINIVLDLATNARNVKSARQQLLTRID